MSRHPGRILSEDFMAELGVTASRLAVAMGVNRSTVGRLVAGQQRLTPQLAARLGACFGVPARWWLLMQAEYDVALVEAHPEWRLEAVPIELSADVLLTPRGVLRLPPAEGAVEPVSLPRREVADLPRDPPVNRAVRQITYPNGAAALVGDP